MPLGAALLSERLWDGAGPIDCSRNISIVPPLDVKALLATNAASVDLRLGRWFRTMQQTKVTTIKLEDDNPKELSKEHYVRFNDTFVLHPGQFVIGVTLEWMKLPHDLSAYVTGKSSWGRRGLIIETAAGIHPGFTGCLTLEFANVGAAPIELKPGMQICQVFFHEVNMPANHQASATATQFIGYRKPVLGHVKHDAIVNALSKDYFA